MLSQSEQDYSTALHGRVASNPSDSSTTPSLEARLTLRPSPSKELLKRRLMEDFQNIPLLKEDSIHSDTLMQSPSLSRSRKRRLPTMSPAMLLHTLQPFLSMEDTR